METTKGNKLIAEFMGLKYFPETANHGIIDNSWGNVKTGEHFFELKYHSSWDWLMPVVKKIRDKGGCTSAIYEKWFETMRDELVDGNILVIWESCVEFIEWYNKQK